VVGENKGKLLPVTEVEATPEIVVPEISFITQGNFFSKLPILSYDLPSEVETECDAVLPLTDPL
jgi:hypothetical protein